ncbi:hypothetical protein HOO65_050589 [Ceratocystis lukuohia]|uniref:Uncharacterized protein n=1 Tax=Ceratocystis lukuohia TaxID=2019550 RepID=A0ABR4MGR2_9PEZI
MQRWAVTLLLAFAASALAAPGSLQNVGENKNLDGDASVSKRVIVGCGFVNFDDVGWVCICVDDEEGPFPADDEYCADWNQRKIVSD